MEQLNNLFIKFWDRVNEEDFSIKSISNITSTIQRYSMEEICEMDSRKLYSVFNKMTFNERKELVSLLVSEETNLQLNDEIVARFLDALLQINVEKLDYEMNSRSTLSETVNISESVAELEMPLSMKSDEFNLVGHFAALMKYKDTNSVNIITTYDSVANDSMSDEQLEVWLQSQSINCLRTNPIEVLGSSAMKRKGSDFEQQELETIKYILTEDEYGNMVVKPIAKLDKKHVSFNLTADEGDSLPSDISNLHVNEGDGLGSGVRDLSIEELPNSELENGLIEECPVCGQRFSTILKKVTMETIETHINGHG